MAFLFTAVAFAGLLEASLLAPSTMEFWFIILCSVFFVGAFFWNTFASMSMSLLAFSFAALSLYFLHLSQNTWFSQGIILFSSIGVYALARTFRNRVFVFGASLSFLFFFGALFSVLRFHFFSHGSLFVVVPMVFFITSFIFFVSEKIMLPALEPLLKIRLAVFSLFAGLLIGEFYAVFSELPFNILTIDFMLFIIYYTLWDMTARYFSHSFTKRSLINSCAVCVFSFVLLLFSAFWFPL